MPVTVKLPTQLRDATGGQAEVSGEGATVGEVLESLYGRYDALRDRLCGDDGELRRFVNVYVAGEDIRFLDGLQTEVAEGSELNVLPAAAGGACPARAPGRRAGAHAAGASRRGRRACASSWRATAGGCGSRRRTARSSTTRR